MLLNQPIPQLSLCHGVSDTYQILSSTASDRHGLRPSSRRANHQPASTLASNPSPNPEVADSL